MLHAITKIHYEVKYYRSVIFDIRINQPLQYRTGVVRARRHMPWMRTGGGSSAGMARHTPSISWCPICTAEAGQSVGPSCREMCEFCKMIPFKMLI
ncbi:hypothetical protein PoB_002058400 [Plakobranchus ocellatus]|uniref:Uncharacterized protein n=1 Tax=Plakobranchus ocellatus TaxID=259542 RepID=A0AAV3ZFG7_9GAST|nr:hypothetical protein PoB_002058400 [Plakobranchus ocellatus]